MEYYTYEQDSSSIASLRESCSDGNGSPRKGSPSTSTCSTRKRKRSPPSVWSCLEVSFRDAGNSSDHSYVGQIVEIDRSRKDFIYRVQWEGQGSQEWCAIQGAKLLTTDRTGDVKFRHSEEDPRVLPPNSSSEAEGCFARSSATERRSKRLISTSARPMGPDRGAQAGGSNIARSVAEPAHESSTGNGSWSPAAHTTETGHCSTTVAEPSQCRSSRQRSPPSETHGRGSQEPALTRTGSSACLDRAEPPHSGAPVSTKPFAHQPREPCAAGCCLAADSSAPVTAFIHFSEATSTSRQKEAAPVSPATASEPEEAESAWPTSRFSMCVYLGCEGCPSCLDGASDGEDSSECESEVEEAEDEAGAGGAGCNSGGVPGQARCARPVAGDSEAPGPLHYGMEKVDNGAAAEAPEPAALKQHLQGEDGVLQDGAETPGPADPCGRDERHSRAEPRCEQHCSPRRGGRSQHSWQSEVQEGVGATRGGAHSGGSSRWSDKGEGSREKREVESREETGADGGMECLTQSAPATPPAAGERTQLLESASDELAESNREELLMPPSPASPSSLAAPELVTPLTTQWQQISDRTVERVRPQGCMEQGLLTCPSQASLEAREATLLELLGLRDLCDLRQGGAESPTEAEARFKAHEAFGAGAAVTGLPGECAPLSGSPGLHIGMLPVDPFAALPAETWVPGLRGNPPCYPVGGGEDGALGRMGPCNAARGGHLEMDRRASDAGALPEGGLPPQREAGCCEGLLREEACLGCCCRCGDARGDMECGDGAGEMEVREVLEVLEAGEEPDAEEESSPRRELEADEVELRAPERASRAVEGRASQVVEASWVGIGSRVTPEALLARGARGESEHPRVSHALEVQGAVRVQLGDAWDTQRNRSRLMDVSWLYKYRARLKNLQGEFQHIRQSLPDRGGFVKQLRVAEFGEDTFFGTLLEELQQSFRGVALPQRFMTAPQREEHFLQQMRQEAPLQYQHLQGIAFDALASHSGPSAEEKSAPLEPHPWEPRAIVGSPGSMLAAALEQCEAAAVRSGDGAVVAGPANRGGESSGSRRVKSPAGRGPGGSGAMAVPEGGIRIGVRGSEGGEGRDKSQGGSQGRAPMLDATNLDARAQGGSGGAPERAKRARRMRGSGVVSPWLHLMGVSSTFCMHFEDYAFGGANVVLAPPGDQAWVVWFSIPRRGLRLLHQYLQQTQGSKYSIDCLEQRQLWLDPRDLAAWRNASGLQIPVYRHVQGPGEYILTDYGSVHWGVNIGVGWKTSVNFAFPGWSDKAKEVDEVYRELELQTGQQRHQCCAPNFSLIQCAGQA
ncbi:hypothetical protein CYMTET_7744 [Cymbomonas tetramitiformis]|uniref:JmjC domain-containing protein n=1 Tax=Cymbomonas tetramitiformis TaxID=36881 RepID=A0AAE0GV20_9CHLO|nr:hypothetical protein CYMTET_7744 [Cymbomonas tetramitiformis]